MTTRPSPSPIQTLREQGIWVSKSDHFPCPDFQYFVTDCQGNLVKISSPLKYLITILVKDIF